MARIKMAYLGGGSTRAAGTMASFIHHRGADFDGSEVVLIDLVPDRLALVETPRAEDGRAPAALDITITSTTDRRAGLDRLRRDPLELPAGRLRGARARRADREPSTG